MNQLEQSNQVSMDSNVSDIKVSVIIWFEANHSFNLLFLKVDDAISALHFHIVKVIEYEIIVLRNKDDVVQVPNVDSLHD